MSEIIKSNGSGVAKRQPKNSTRGKKAQVEDLQIKAEDVQVVGGSDLVTEAVRAADVEFSLAARAYSDRYSQNTQRLLQHMRNTQQNVAGAIRGGLYEAYGLTDADVYGSDEETQDGQA